MRGGAGRIRRAANRELGDGQRWAVNVGVNTGAGVIDQDVARDGRILGHRIAVIGRDRRVVDGFDRQADGGDVAISRAVVDLVGEAVGAEVVEVWLVGEGAVGVERQHAMRRARYQRRGQRIAVDVAVVALGAAQNRREGQGCIFVGRVAIVDRHRRVFDGVDRDRDRLQRHATVAVAELDDKAIGPVVVGSWRVGIGAICVDSDRAMRRRRVDGEGDGVAIHVCCR